MSAEIGRLDMPASEISQSLHARADVLAAIARRIDAFDAAIAAALARRTVAATHRRAA